ncbi:hypothetical protein WR25_17057 [Diploscapter pachys]|uniref:Hda lid domain-containing protein n=1 Tax=Diploscapter pachys TaxID=2018661 RepID=A0A2A2K659_9BILA|nr:hypothetical protein WR25_17057 [Diploscapter pachys]
MFHLFNRLRDSGRRLLLAASSSPRELPIKLADLKSRLTLALIFQMRGMSDEDKLRALQLRASRRGLHLTDEVGHFILTPTASRTSCPYWPTAFSNAAWR